MSIARNILIVAIYFIAFHCSFAQKCHPQAICYALDQSGSIDNTEYAQVQNFTKISARVFAVPNHTTKYSAVAFSSIKKTIQEPTEDLEGEFVPAIESLRVFQGGTNIYSGLRGCYEILTRNMLPYGNVIILITDGYGQRGSSPMAAIRAANISVVSVGIGPGVNELFLRSLATSPQFFIPTSSFATLQDLPIRLASTACNAVIEVSKPTPSMSATSSPSVSASVSTSASISPSASISSSPSTSLSPSASSTSSPSASVSATPSTSASASTSISPFFAITTPEESMMVMPSQEPSMEPSLEPITGFGAGYTPDISQEYAPESTTETSVDSVFATPNSVSPTRALKLPLPQSISPIAGTTCSKAKCTNAIEECRVMVNSACSCKSN